MMKYMYWFLISSLVIWEMTQLKDIFGFSAVFQIMISIVLILYFAYLFDIDFKALKITNYIKQKNQMDH